MKRWLSLCAAMIGVALIVIGVYNWQTLVTPPLEAKRTYLPQTVLPLIAGVWLVVGGVYFLISSDVPNALEREEENAERSESA